MAGAVLYDAADPAAAARSLADILAASTSSQAQVRAAGFEPTLVDALRHALPHDAASIHVACMEGAAWVEGRRSAPAADTWELVVSLPPTMQLPPRLRRTTGETLVGMVSEAERSVRLVAPYVDEAGLGIVADVAAAATMRGVAIEVFRQSRWRSTELDALDHLQRVVVERGDLSRLSVVTLNPEAPFGHLKVLTVDAFAAYVGSANITAAALMGRNVELGVLLRGRDVAVIDRLLDSYRTV